MKELGYASGIGCIGKVLEMTVDLVAKAFDFANKAHAGQIVKGTMIPYISHPMAVASIVWEFGGTSEQVAAALLHDVIEDTETSADTLRKEFGDLVATIVNDCSDSFSEPKPPWRARKENYLKHLAESSHADTVLVSLADKFHNVNRILNDLSRLKGRTDELWKLFSAPPDQIVWYYLGLHLSFNERLNKLPTDGIPNFDKLYLLLLKFQSSVYMLETKVSQILPEDYRVFHVDGFDDESDDRLWQTFKKRDDAVLFARAYAKMKTWEMAEPKVDELVKSSETRKNLIKWADYLVVRYKDGSLLFSTGNLGDELKALPIYSEYLILRRNCLEEHLGEVEAFEQLVESVQRQS